MVLFFCTDCHEAGEWDACSTQIWLTSETPVVTQTLRGSAPLRQCVQYYGPDDKHWYDMPDDMQNELERIEAEAASGCIRLPPSYGTKAGGNPAYLQSAPKVFDRAGKLMEYIGQIATPEHIPAGGFGYIFYSPTTQETQVVFQDT